MCIVPGKSGARLLFRYVKKMTMFLRAYHDGGRQLPTCFFAKLNVGLFKKYLDLYKVLPQLPDRYG